MKRFKTKNIKKERIDLLIFIVAIITVIFLHYYNKNISPKVLELGKDKIGEITTIYIKNDIMPKQTDLNRLIKVNTFDGEIKDVDIDMDYANVVMDEVVEKIENNITKLESGDISTFKNANELKSYNNNLFIKIPLGLSFDGLLFSNLGPKIPVKISFYEHVLGNVDVELSEYGINNALLKVYMIVSLEQKITIPYSKEKVNQDYKLLLGSKVINGTVPSIYGSSYKKSSSILSSVLDI